MNEFAVHVLYIDRDNKSPVSVMGDLMLYIFLSAWELIAEKSADPDDLISVFYELGLSEDYDALHILSPVAFLSEVLTEHAV